MKNSAILLVSCPDAKGEVATIADFVYRHGGNILHADEHADEESGLFLMRVEFGPTQQIGRLGVNLKSTTSWARFA
jgi:formyltetrahydrofolate hydrolase